MVVRLDDQMEVIVLRAEVQEAETIVGGGGERGPDEREHPRGPQAADGPTRAERDVHRVRGDVQLPWGVLNAGPTARGKLAPGPSATATPGARSGQAELLQGTRHLDSAIK